MPKKSTTPPPTSCDWVPQAPKVSKVPKSAPKPLKPRLHRHRPKDCSWTGVATERYKTEDASTWSRVLRRVLIGNHGEHSKFHLRYFEIAPGGHTTHETHKHEHVVLCVRGQGQGRLGTRLHTLHNMDLLYIPPNTPHQLLNPTEAPFGFLCIVDAKRDRPKPIKRKPSTRP